MGVDENQGVNERLAPRGASGLKSDSEEGTKKADEVWLREELVD